MAGPRNLDADRVSLRELVDETLYTAVRVRQSPEAKPQLALAESLLTNARAGLALEDKLSESLIEADAGVILRNLDLDGFVVEHRGVVQRKTRGKTEHKLYQRFYGSLTPHAIIRLGLRSELPVIEPWLESLKRDPDNDLQALATPLEKVLADGRKACEAQDHAVQAIRDYRAGKRAQLFESVNAGRRTIWAAISALPDGVDLASSLFRVSAGRPRAGELTLSVAEAAVATAESQLKEAQAQLAAVKAQEHAAAAEAAARIEAQRALAEAEAQAAALAARIATLRAAS